MTSRRAALRVLGAASLAPLVARAQPATVNGVLVSGRALPGMDGIDATVTSIMQAHAVPGCALAIAHDGKLKLARGYGYADVQGRAPMRAETRVALASISKVITAQTVLKLVEQGRLQFSDRVFSFFRELQPPPGMREDPRLGEITVEMCLHHTGGWDRKTSGDPSGWGPRMSRALRIDHPPTPLEAIQYMKGVPLDFTPGTQQVYSNFGYQVLGAVVAAVTRQGYPEYVQQNTLRPMGVTGLRIDDVPPRYLPGEARRYITGSEHEVPGGNPRLAMASGGWQASCVDMARVMTAIDGSRTGTPFLSPAMMQAMVQPAAGISRPAQDRWMGLGWDLVEKFPGPGGDERYTWGKDGGLTGIQAYVEHLAIGSNFALLFNSSPPGGPAENPGGRQLIQPKVVDFIRQTPPPEGDLFSAFS